jgi:signal transduction histidine kinase
VADDGSAPSDLELERLLEPFFTTRPGRSGLGLKIARRLLERWDGRLGLEKRTDAGGLVARVSLPRAR